MPATVKAPLGATTTNRKWYLDVAEPGETPSWVGVFGMTEFSGPKREGNTEEDSDMDSGGFQSETKTAEKWSAEGKVRRGVTTASATAYDPGQELIRLRSQGKFGPAASLLVRIYEMEPGGPRVEAYEGLATASWSEDGGGMSDLSMASFTLGGQGALEPIEHPDTP